MVLYKIILVPLLGKIRAVDPELLLPFYADNSAFYKLVQWSARLMTLFMEKGADWG